MQSKGDFELFEKLFDDEFIDHTPQPGPPPIRMASESSITVCAKHFRTSTPTSSGSPPPVTWSLPTRSTAAPRREPFLGVAPTGRPVEFETVDVMRVVEGKIVEHWGVGNLLKVMTQLGAITL